MFSCCLSGETVTEKYLNVSKRVIVSNVSRPEPMSSIIISRGMLGCWRHKQLFQENMFTAEINPLMTIINIEI